MKKVFSLMLLLATLMVSFTACSDDKDEPDDIKSQIVGTWDATSVKFSDSEWIDISNRPNMSLSMTFNSDGSYYGRGALGNGSGTYTISGKTVKTYVDGELYGHLLRQEPRWQKCRTVSHNGFVEYGNPSCETLTSKHCMI